MIKHANAPYCPLKGDDRVNRCRREECGWWDHDIGACVAHRIAASLAALVAAKEGD